MLEWSEDHLPTGLYHSQAAAAGKSESFVTVPASSIIHVFRQDRPGQHWGVLGIAPALGVGQEEDHLLGVRCEIGQVHDPHHPCQPDVPQPGDVRAVDCLATISCRAARYLICSGGVSAVERRG
jgi:hypothetical protein